MYGTNIIKKVCALVVCVVVLIPSLCVVSTFDSVQKSEKNFEIRKPVDTVYRTIKRVNTTPERLQTIPVGHSLKITAQAYDENSDEILFGVVYSWSMDDPTIGSLNPMTGDETIFTAINPGWVNVTVSATYNSTTVSNQLPIEVPYSLEYYATLSSSPINIVYKPITQPAKNSRIQINININRADWYIENNMSVIRAKAELWDGSTYPDPGTTGTDYLQFPCINPSHQYYTQYMYGYLSNSIYFPAGTLVMWWIFARICNDTETIQINSTIYEYVVDGAWERPGRDYRDPARLFLENVNVTFSPKEPRSYEPVTVTIKSLYDVPMYTVIFIWIKPKPGSQEDVWYPAEPPNNPMGGHEYGMCKPMYGTVQQFKIPAYPAYTEVVFTIMTRDETAAPYYHYIPSNYVAGCYDTIHWRYKVSPAGLFNGTSFEHNIIIKSYPYVLNTTEPYQTISQYRDVRITIYSNKSDVTILDAGCFYEVEMGTFICTGQGKFTRNTSTELYYDIPGQAYGSIVKFHVKVWDTALTQLVSPVYTYLVERPPDPITKEYSYIEGRVIDEKLSEGLQYYFVSGVNVTIENKTLKYHVSMRTDGIGRFFTKQPDSNEPKFFKIGTKFAFTVKYLPAQQRKAYVLKFNVTLKTEDQFYETLFADASGYTYAKVRVDNNTIYIYFNPPIKELPTVYAQPEGFADWYHYVTILACVCAIIPIVLCLTKMRRKREEEQKRVTL